MEYGAFKGNGFKRIKAVFLKDLMSEYRTRYAVAAVVLFIVTTITMIIFSASGEKFTTGTASGLLWIIMFFSAMTGMSRSFVSEEERNTILFLKLNTTSSAVYFGKLLFNNLLNLAFNSFAMVLFFLFVESVQIKSIDIFISVLILGSMGIASASTIISAIIAKASAKGAIFPVLSFPVLLPLIIIGTETTRFALDGFNFSEAFSNIQLMLAYCGILIAVSFILFDQIWAE